MKHRKKKKDWTFLCQFCRNKFKASYSRFTKLNVKFKQGGFQMVFPVVCNLSFPLTSWKP